MTWGPKNLEEAKKWDYRSASYHAPRPYDPAHCAAQVTYYLGRWPQLKQCEKKPGHGPDNIFCKIHDPAYIAEKNRKADEKSREKWKLRLYEIYGKRFYDALVQIRDGHNDPRTLARETLAVIDERKDV